MYIWVDLSLNGCLRKFKCFFCLPSMRMMLFFRRKNETKNTDITSMKRILFFCHDTRDQHLRIWFHVLCQLNLAAYTLMPGKTFLACVLVYINCAEYLFLDSCHFLAKIYILSRKKNCPQFINLPNWIANKAWQKNWTSLWNIHQHGLSQLFAPSLF